MTSSLFITLASSESASQEYLNLNHLISKFGDYNPAECGLANHNMFYLNI